MRKIIQLVAVGVLAGMPAIAQGCPGCGGRFWDRDGSWGGMMGWGAWAPLTLLSNLVFWIALIALGLYIFKKVIRSSENEGKDKAIDTLRQRFAQGEISQEEFEQKKNWIEKS